MRSCRLAKHSKDKPVLLFISDNYSGVTPWLTQGALPSGLPHLPRILEELDRKYHVIVVYPCRRVGCTPHDLELEIVPVHLPRSRSRGLRVLERAFQMVQVFVVSYWLAVRRHCAAVYATGYMITVGCLVARLAGIGIVGRVYGTFLHVGSEQQGILTALRSIPEVLVFRSPVDYLVVTNDGTRGDKVAQYCGVPMERLRFWVNGVDKKLLGDLLEKRAHVRAELGIAPATAVIASVGRLTRWKRVDLVVRGYARMLEMVENVRCELRIVGGGEMMPSIKELVAKLGISDRVCITGVVDHLTALRHIVASDVLVFCYEHSNVGSVLLEALCLGRAVICRDTGDTKEFVRNGVNGFLVPDGPDAAIEEGVAKTLVEILSNPRRTNEISQRALEMSTCIPDWSTRIAREVALIDQIVRGHK